jgi:hypothetical protein
VIDLREDQSENASDSMGVNSESVSNEIDESEVQDGKHDESRYRKCRGINVDVIRSP